MIRDSLTYPFKSNPIAKMLTGSLFVASSIIILPLFTLIGYSIEVITSARNGNKAPPEFNHMIKTTKNGIVGFGIILIYTTIPTAVLLLLLAGLTTIQSTIQLSRPVFTIIAFVIITITAPVILTTIYALPAALTNYGIEGEFKSAFDFRKLINIIFTVKYNVILTYSVLITLIISITSVLMSSTIFTVIFTPFINFYGLLSVSYICGKAYKQGESTDIVSWNDLKKLVIFK